MKRNAGKIALLAGACMVLAAGAHAQDQYVIGITGDLSGPSSGTYKPMVEGVRVYFDNLNDKGGIDGKKVQLLIRDSRGDPNQVVTDLTYFDGEGAVMTVFSSPSGTLGAYARQNASLQIPTMYVNACYPPATPPSPDPNFFCAGISTLTDSFTAVDLIADVMGDEPIRLGLLTTDIPGARGAAEQIMKPYAEQKGIEVVDVSALPLTTSDASSIARSYAESGVNAVISYTISTHMLAGASALSSIGWDGKYLLALYLPGVHDQVIELKNENILGFDHFSLVEEDKPVHREMKEAAAKYNFGYTLNDMRIGYLNGLVIADALAKCGWPCDRDGLREVLNDLTVDSQDVVDLNLNPVRFTQTNHTGPEKLYRVYGWSQEKGGLDTVLDSFSATERDWK